MTQVIMRICVFSWKICIVVSCWILVCTGVYSTGVYFVLTRFITVYAQHMFI